MIVCNTRILLAIALCTLAIAFAAVGFGSAPTSSPTTTSGTWSVVGSANTPAVQAPSFTKSVECLSASDCWAIGWYIIPGSINNGTLIEHWDGNSWTVATAPRLGASQNVVLYGLTCASASDCWAVGYYQVSAHVLNTLIEHWNGSVWTVVSSPNASVSNSTLTQNTLSSVSCASESDCWAVGYTQYLVNDILSKSAAQTLIEHWDGASWTIVTSPNSPNSSPLQPANALAGVTCASTLNCWAVGSYTDSTTGKNQSLIQRWDGSSWTIISSVSSPTGDDLNSITCTSESDCWAVGNYNGIKHLQTFIEHWDGSSWSLVQSPNSLPTENNRLFNVTCASASECWAVGDVYDGTVYSTLIERWNGSLWTIVTSANTSTTQGNHIWDVSCASVSDCWGVGPYLSDDQTMSFVLTEHWDGNAWTIVSAPNVTLPQDNGLAGVTCLSSSDCWAVASYNNGGVEQTLTEHWDSISWNVVDSPNISSAHDSVLSGVSCNSSSDCWAAGYSNNGSALRTLIERWNGTAWALFLSPNTGSLDNALSGVTCSSSSDCWTVGYYNNGNADRTLIERWNGSSWNAVISPNTDDTYSNRLSSITCNSAADCWAVGYHDSGGGVLQTLTEHWDGASWTIIGSPNNVTAQTNQLSAITCSTASDCWTVGRYSNGAASQTLIEHWDGASWSIVASPNNGTENNQLNGIACSSSFSCWATGYYSNAGVNQTLVEHWDGASWLVVASPNNSTNDNLLFGVTCSSGTDCWSAGYYYDEQGTKRTLTEHYLPGVSPTSIVSRKAHGTVGTFDVDLTANSIECRSGGTNGNYQLVFTFASPLTSVEGARVTSGTGSIANNSIDSTDPHNYIVNLTGVANAQTITVGLTNVADSAGNFGPTVAASMKVLIGDVNGSGLVDSGDVFLVRQQTGKAVGSSNFREDVNATGVIDSGDVFVTRQQTGTVFR